MGKQISKHYFGKVRENCAEYFLTSWIPPLTKVAYYELKKLFNIDDEA